MDLDDLKEILDQHAKWLRGEGGRQADLIGADLRNVNLSGTNLSRVDLRSANLSGTNLVGTNLSWADLRNANLSGTNLVGTNLVGANLVGAILSSANLIQVDLRGTNLIGADLRSANLIGVNICHIISGDNKVIHVMQTGAWSVVISNEDMAIGCQQHKIDDWFNFDDEIISEMDKDALPLWREWKPILKSIIDLKRRSA